MTPIEWEGHAVRLSGSAGRLADIIGMQALSLARFPKDRLSVEMVTYDLLAATVHAVLLQLTNHEPSTARTMVAQFADELRLMLEDAQS